MSITGETRSWHGDWPIKFLFGNKVIKKINFLFKILLLSLSFKSSLEEIIQLCKITRLDEFFELESSQCRKIIFAVG